MSIFHIAKQISPADAARRLGLTESHGRFSCPFHDDHHPSMACYADTRRFYCFTCHARGDATDLWAKVRGLTPRAAAEELCAEFAVPCSREDRAEQERKQRIDAVAMLPQAVWQDWHRGQIALLEGQIDAAVALMQSFPDPEGWLWQFALDRVTLLQDELNRIKGIEPRLLAAEVAERRAEPQAYAGQIGITEELLRRILADRLRHTGMRLDPKEADYVYRTLQISSPQGC